MKKMKLLLAFAAAMVITGCGGTTWDLTANPADIAQTQGIDAAIEWCDNRDVDLGVVESVKAISQVAGMVFDVATLPVVLPGAIVLAGEQALDYTTLSRHNTCAELRKSGGDG